MSVVAERDGVASILLCEAGPGVYAGGASLEELKGFILELSAMMLVHRGFANAAGMVCFTYLVDVSPVKMRQTG